MARVHYLKYEVNDDSLQIERYGRIVPSNPKWLEAIRYNRDRIAIVDGIDVACSLQQFLKLHSPAIFCPLLDWSSQLAGGYFRSVEGRNHHDEFGPLPFIFPNSRQEHKIIFMVEGYLDMLSVELAHPMVFAMTGGSLSPFQLDWLKLMKLSGWKFRLIFMHDNDDNKSGKDGAFRSVESCSGAGIYGHTLATPFGAKDPGDLYGDRKFIEHVKNIVRSLSK